MKYFIDFEFTEGFHKPFLGKKRHYIDMISVGIVCEDGREYYSVSKDFDVEKVWNTWQQRTGQGDRNNHDPKEYWLRENVLLPIFKDFYPDNLSNLHHYPTFNYSNMKSVIKNLGKSNEAIANEIYQFICSIDNANEYAGVGSLDFGAEGYLTMNPPKFYGYYADYDWVLFCSLFGKMIDLPKGYPMYCNDLIQIFNDTVENNKTVICEKFCINPTLDVKTVIKELKQLSIYPKQGNEHNALSDARWNRHLHGFLFSLLR
jgi:3' exoribonuclease, RNase T-like